MKMVHVDLIGGEPGGLEAHGQKIAVQREQRQPRNSGVVLRDQIGLIAIDRPGSGLSDPDEESGAEGDTNSQPHRPILVQAAERV